MVDCVGLGNEIAQLAARLNVATHRLLTCVRQFDEAGGWHRQGAQSCAHWLTWRIGLDPGAAREKVRVAKALGTLPKLDAAFAAGKLSYAKVRAVTRIATPANEERVVEVALAATGAQLERICRGYRKATAGELEAAEERRVRARVLGDGLVKLEIVVSADEAELVMKAVEAALARLTPAAAIAAPDVSAETPKATTESQKAYARADVEPRAPRPSAADALVHLASEYLSRDNDGDDPGASTATRSSSLGPTHAEVIIHVDRDLTSPTPSLTAALEDGTPVSAETLRRAACDGGLVVAALDDQGTVLDIGRRTRAIPPAIRRALWIRDTGCRFPGCPNTKYLHGHHVKHWLHGGRTSLDNLVMLCSFHHRMVHEGGFDIRIGADAQVIVRAPDGAALSATPDLAADPGALQWRNDWWDGPPQRTEAAIDVDEWTTLPTWDGDAVDYDSAVEAMLPG